MSEDSGDPTSTPRGTHGDQQKGNFGKTTDRQVDKGSLATSTKIQTFRSQVKIPAQGLNPPINTPSKLSEAGTPKDKEDAPRSSSGSQPTPVKIKSAKADNKNNSS